MNTSKQIHNKIKEAMISFVDDDLKNILSDIINNQEPYDEKSMYEENIILRLQNQRSLNRLNNNLENLTSVLKNTNNSKNDADTCDDC